MDILVIILAITLAIFLVIAIVLVINLIKISKQVKHITDSAENAVNNLSKTSNFVKSTAGKASMVKLMSTIAEIYKEKSSKKK